jgi:hypothetical protein
MSRQSAPYFVLCLALAAFSAVLADTARAQTPREEACEVQLRIAGEWTVPHACVIHRDGTRARIEPRGALGVSGTFEMASASPRLDGRMVCGEPACAEPFDRRIDVPITEFDIGGVRGFDGDAVVGSEDVPFRVVRGGTPLARVQSSRPPRTVARANVPVLRDFAGAWDVRFQDGQSWQGSFDATITRTDRGLRIVIAPPAPNEVDATLTVRSRGGIPDRVAVAGTFTGDEGARSRFRGTLSRQSDGAYVGRLGPRGPRIELRPRAAVPPDITGDYLCRVRGESGTFRCPVASNADMAWMEPDRSSTAPYTLEGTIVGTPAGFRVVWGTLQCLSGENQCQTQSMAEFVPDASVDGWRGYFPLRGRFVEIEMTRGR